MLVLKSNLHRWAYYSVGMIALFVVGCAAVPPGSQFQPLSEPPKSKGVIYIYKPDSYGKSIYDIYANGELVTTLFKGGYYPYVANPGENTIAGIKKARVGEILTVLLGVEPDIEISVYVEAGKSYYVERKGGLLVKFELVPEDEALPLLRDAVLLSPAIKSK